MRFTVSILTYIALPQAKRCIASVLKSTASFKLVLTANGNQEAADYFTGLSKEFPFITVHINPTNEGFIPPNLRAFAACDTELFVMLNDDTIVPPDWLEKLAAPFDQFPATAALSGPRGGCQSLQPSFHGYKSPAFEYLEGSCLCVKVEKVRPFGLFDPHLKFAYGEDSDLSLRMREAGLTLHHADFYLTHEVGATSKHVKDVRKTQEENHTFLRRRWEHYMKFRRMEFPIILRRGAAFGDVLLTTPIIRELRRVRPLSPIYVETSCPQIFIGNPNVKQVDRRAPKMNDALLISLDGAYENGPAKHIVEAYAERAGVPIEDKRTDLFLAEADLAFAARMMPEGEWVAIHAGPSTWKSKEWPEGRFTEVIRQLQTQGFRVVLVGSHGKALASDSDQRGHTTVQQMGAIIKRSKLFIGLDSLPFHVAEAVGTTAIGLFGITDPQYISTRDGGSWCVCATAGSFGLRHRVKGVTVVDDGGQAMASISVEAVMARVAQVPREVAV